jgi:hypothetical protein
MSNPDGIVLLLGGAGLGIAVAGVVGTLIACFRSARSAGSKRGLAAVALATVCAIAATAPLVAEVLSHRIPLTQLVTATIPFVALGLCLGVVRELLAPESPGRSVDLRVDRILAAESLGPPPSPSRRTESDIPT